MNTRPLLHTDIANFRALWLDGLHRYPLAFLWDVADVECLTDDQLTVMIDNGHLLGLFQGTEMVGFAGVGHRPNARTCHRAMIGPFYVSPALHGSDAANTLMHGCLGMAASKGAWMIDLYVAANNPRAIRFYERHGFLREGRMPAAIVVNGVPYDDFYYCLTLPH